MRRELELGWRCLAKCDVAENSGAGSTSNGAVRSLVLQEETNSHSSFLL
jgi:hypothetical protein